MPLILLTQLLFSFCTPVFVKCECVLFFLLVYMTLYLDEMFSINMGNHQPFKSDYKMDLIIYNMDYYCHKLGPTLQYGTFGLGRPW
jgi:hypothetical protein